MISSLASAPENCFVSIRFISQEITARNKLSLRLPQLGMAIAFSKSVSGSLDGPPTR